VYRGTRQGVAGAFRGLQRAACRGVHQKQSTHFAWLCDVNEVCAQEAWQLVQLCEGGAAGREAPLKA
jgi:hypothetical protein